MTKFLVALTLLFALELCAPQAQLKSPAPQDAPNNSQGRVVKPRAENRAARTIVCVDPGHASCVA